MELLGLLLSGVLKDLANKKGYLMSLRRGFDLYFLPPQQILEQALVPFRIYYTAKKKEKQTAANFDFNLLF